MRNDNGTTTSGLGFVGALTIVFVALKLTHTIDWPWIWVVSPLWITALGALGALLMVALLVLIFRAVAHWQDGDQ